MKHYLIIHFDKILRKLSIDAKMDHVCILMKTSLLQSSGLPDSEVHIVEVSENEMNKLNDVEVLPDKIKILEEKEEEKMVSDTINWLTEQSPEKYWTDEECELIYENRDHYIVELSKDPSSLEALNFPHNIPQKMVSKLVKVKSKIVVAEVSLENKKTIAEVLNG